MNKLMMIGRQANKHKMYSKLALMIIEWNAKYLKEKFNLGKLNAFYENSSIIRFW